MDGKRPAVISCLLLACLLTLGLAQATSFGESHLSLERAWTVTGAKGVAIDFWGALSVNNSFQQIVSVETTPQLDQEMRNGTLWVHYHGIPDSDNFTITGTVVAAVDYDPDIPKDSPVPGAPLNGTNQTQYDEAIARQASLLSQNSSSLETVRALTDWVYHNVTYDLAYWGKPESALEVFSQRRAVCVGYTHLLIAMARSLGFDTRYVSGYIYDSGWQQHAWAEIFVPGYGWLPADATFDQVGTMYDTHFGVRYGADQSDTYDTLQSTSQSVDLQALDAPQVIFETNDSKGVSVSLQINKQDYVVNATLRNSRPEYVFGTYQLQLPEKFGGDSSSVVLLPPGGETQLYQVINQSLFGAGYTYRFPVVVSFNDATASENLTVPGEPPAPESGNTRQSPQAPVCASGAAFLLLLCACAAKQVA